jgi:serine phosphatase RsbU (regulator of sigma subunit)
MVEVGERQETLACLEVWGGNRSVIRNVDLPELTAWVYSKPLEAEDGGDVHYLSVCGQAVLSRVVLADVSGHGVGAGTSAQLLHALMREHINTWDQTEFVSALNQSFLGCASQGKYATVVILGVLRGTGETAFTNAGHLPPLWYRSNARTWGWLDEEACLDQCGVEGLPVGLIPGTTYRQMLIQLQPDDMIVLYTDGITEAEDRLGNMLTRERLMDWAQLAPADRPAATGEFLISQLNDFRQDNFTDDETLIVIQRGGRQ